MRQYIVALPSPVLGDLTSFGQRPELYADPGIPLESFSSRLEEEAETKIKSKRPIENISLEPG